MLAIVFALVFVTGVLLAVLVMLGGVVRNPQGSVPEIPAGAGPFVSRENLAAAAAQLSARYHLPVLAASAVSFGIIGYALSRLTQLGAIAIFAIAGVAGGGLAILAATIVAKWALPAARADVPDERFLLQGHFARVVKAMAGSERGEVAVEINGEVHTAEAVSLEGDPIAAGTEVVIERIEGEVAFVEPWEVVERRI